MFIASRAATIWRSSGAQCDAKVSASNHTFRSRGAKNLMTEESMNIRSLWDEALY